jgi:hypothetical protein
VRAGLVEEIPHHINNKQYNYIGVQKMAEFCRPKVPTGETKYVTTTQKEITPGKFFVGYDTSWVSFQKEVPYQTPKKP